MPNKCCVPGCKSNYKSVHQGYVPVFTFPSDPALKNQWIQSIPRINWTCTKNSVVCLKHFAEDSISYVERYKDAKGQWKEFPRSRSKLLPTAVPSIFPFLPSYIRVKKSGRKYKQRCDKKESGGEQGVNRDCVIFQDINEHHPLTEEKVKVEIESTEHFKECEKKVVKQEPFEEIEIKAESIFDEEEEKFETEKKDPISFKYRLNIIQDTGVEDVCEPFASVMVTPSEDTVEAEGQLQVDPLADNTTTDWRQRVRQRQKSFVCEVCNKTFRLSLLLEVHKRNHSRDVSYTCDICQKKFPKKSCLLTHSRCHTVGKPYACDTDSKVSVDSKQSYGCVMCSSSFTQLSSLMLHQRIHSGYKPFEFQACGKTFSKKSKLVEHAQIHMGKKSYECHVCTRKFALLSSVRKHLKVHGIPWKK